VLSADLESTVHLTAKHGEVSDIVTVPVWNEEKSELVIFAVNRNLSEDVQFEADVRSFGSEFRPVKSVLCSDDLKRENSAEEEPVVPRPDSAVSFVQGKMQTVLKAASWNVIRLMK
jgi:alpha-N-arabinofuranosidase